MRNFGIIILLLTAALTMAETPPPEPPPAPVVPKIMLIHMKDGPTDSIPCSRLDLEVGITFQDHNMRMKVGVIDLIDPILLVYLPSVYWYSTSQIESIKFVPIAPALAKRPTK